VSWEANRYTTDAGFVAALRFPFPDGATGSGTEAGLDDYPLSGQTGR
jgi:hypothetical protein